MDATSGFEPLSPRSERGVTTLRRHGNMAEDWILEIHAFQHALVSTEAQHPVWLIFHLARGVGFEPTTIPASKAGDFANLSTHEYGWLSGIRTQHISVPGRASHPAIYPWYMARLVGIAPTATGFGDQRITSTQTHKLLKKKHRFLGVQLVEDSTIS